MENFGEYTAQAGNIFGYWREEMGAIPTASIASSAWRSPMHRVFQS